MRLKLQHWIIGTVLECLALALANWQALGGVRTDEAKYLLNIPYPHPPLLRWLMSATEVLPFQEMFWRLLLATLLIQAVWLVWDMTRSFAHMEDRIVVCAGWLLSSAVLTQGGAIMLSSATALQGLALLWIRSRPETAKKIPGWIGLFWLSMLLTAYQGFLFLPIVWDILRPKPLRPERPRWWIPVYVFGPVMILILYTLSNPFSVATMMIHGNDGASGSLLERLLGVGKLWLIAGSGVISLVGTWGIVRSKDLPLIASFLLVCAYVTLSVPYAFYTILLTPLLVAGLTKIFAGRKRPHPSHHLGHGAFPFLTCLIAGSALLTWFNQPPRLPGPARQVMATIPPGSGGVVLISGFFGHEWQYESRLPVMRYRPELVKDARAILCLQECVPHFNATGWKLVKDVGVEAWVRK